MISTKSGGQSMTFIVDAGAEHSVLTTCGSPHTRLNSDYCWGHRGHDLSSFCKAHSLPAEAIWGLVNFSTYRNAPFPCYGRDPLAKQGHKSVAPERSL